MQRMLCSAALAIALVGGCARDEGKHAATTTVVPGTTRHAAGFVAGADGNHIPRPLTTPLYFEANLGQTDAQARFLARGPGFQLFLTSTGAVFKLAASVPCPGTPCASKAARTSDLVRMAFAGANPKPVIEGLEPQQAHSNYFIGKDPSGWHRNVGRYAKVRYKGVYPGVDVVFYGNQQALEYDFVVAPHADTGAIAFDLQGVDDVRVDGAGNLVMKTAHGQLQQHRPTVYQEIAGKRVSVDGRYAVLGKERVGFALGAHDPSTALVIDPMFGFSTYLGGSNDDRATGVAVDSQGNTYVSGWTGSAEFPIVGGVQTTTDVYSTAFVTKYDVTGNIVYSTYLGGSSGVMAEAVAVDQDGDAYVAGTACDGNFPVVNAVQDHLAGMCDAFVAKLGSAGDSLQYSTYIGGTGTDADADAAAPYGPYSVHLAVDGMGSAYLTGSTDSDDFPVVNALQSVRGDPAYSGSTDAYIAKLSPDGGTFVYSTYLGGSSSDRSTGIAVDPNGNAIIAGWTTSTDFPSVGAWQDAQGSNGYPDGFIAQLDADGSALVYSSYLGGATTDLPAAVAVDASGNAYVTGTTESPDFPFSAAPGSSCPSSQAGSYTYRGFVVKVAPVGGAVYSSCLRGAEPLSIAVDAVGSVYLTGKTTATDFPTASPLQPQLHTAYADIPDYSIQDAFVSQLSADGTTLLFGTYLGGNNFDSGAGVAVDEAGSIHVVGLTSSVDFPVTDGTMALESPDGFPGLFTNAFVAKIDGGTGIYVSNFGVAEGNGGAHAVDFTVRLSSPCETPVTFDVDTSDGTALEGSDYQGVHQQGVIIEPGRTEKTISMVYFGDTVTEPHETFSIDLSNVQGADVANGHAVGTIGNDDAVVSMGNTSVVEGSGGGLTTVALPIRLSAPVWGAVSIQFGSYDGSATYPSDFVAGTSELNIPAGATVGYAMIDIMGDDAIEPNEYLHPTMSIVHGAIADNTSGGITILNDDTTLSIADASVIEGNSGTKMATFTVSLAQPTVVPVTFDAATANGTAAAGSDYTATRLAGVTIPAGSTRATVSVPVIGDTTPEAGETFKLVLSNVVGAPVADATAIGTIRNDDTRLSIGDINVTEGYSGTKSATFTVRLSNVSALPVYFNAATANRTAIAGADYVARTFNGLSIAAGTTSKTFKVSIVGDRVVEPNESFLVNLYGVKNAVVADAQAIAIIRNDDAVLRIGDASIAEGNSGTKTLAFTVRLSAPLPSPVTLSVATANKTAIAGSDYVALSLTGQSIPAGSTSKAFKVTIKGDTLKEPSETFLVNVPSVSVGNYASVTIGDAQALGTIINDD